MDSSERRPLLDDVEGEQDVAPGNQAPKNYEDDSFLTRILAEPLTTLAKVLLFVAVALLLLSSIFIGLFAGAEHKISDLKHKYADRPMTTTITETRVQSTTRTKTATETYISTTTISPPVHTEPPKPVRLLSDSKPRPP